MDPEDSSTPVAPVPDPEQTPGLSPVSASPSAPPPAHAPPAQTKPIRILACVLCQHRKIKCDRAQPQCANCVRAGVKCTPSTPAPARKRRRPNQDLQERLARCEELIKQYAGSAGAAELAISASPSTMSTPTKTPTASEDSQYLQWRPAGKVTSGDGTSKFVDSHLWANLHNELKAMKNILEEDDSQEQYPLVSTDFAPDDFEDVILYGSPAESVDAFQPEPVHIFRLWQMYIDRVNPLNKVIHVPSVQPYMVEAQTNPSNITPRIQALLFAIYTLATVSMEEYECQQILGMPRDTAINRFSEGTKAALAKSKFLRFFDMTTVQTLFIHQMSLQSRYGRDSMWIIHGINVRVAQKLGFHRDGEALGLTPFETEMQRRIWWQVIMQDAKLALHSGLSPSHSPSLWDTKLPLNINDADMFPGSTEPIQPREGPTEMAFCLLSYRMHMCLVSNGAMLPAYEAILLGQQLANTPDATEQMVKNYKAIAVGIEEELKEVEEKYVDPAAGPTHVMAKMFRPMVMEKVWSILAPMREQPEWGSEIFSPRDNLFKMMVTSAHQSLAYYDVMTEAGFLWFIKQHFQLDIFAVILGQLCRRVRGALVDKAWDTVDKTYRYHTEMHDMTQKKYVMLGLFALKAWKAREAALRQAGSPVIVPECIILLRDIMPAGQNTPSSEMMSIYASRPSTAATPTSRPHGLSVGASASPIVGTMPAPVGPAKQGSSGPEPALDQILQDSWGMAGLDWDIWNDTNMGGMQGNQIPVQGARLSGFGGTSNGFGW